MSKVPNYEGHEVVMLPVPASRLGEVFALLGSASGVALAAAVVASAPSAQDAPKGTTEANTAQTGVSGAVTAGEVDAAGTVFDPARHTGTKVASGLWRMKTGQSRPEHEGEKSANYVDPRVSPAGTAANSSAGANGSVAGAAGTSTGAQDDEDDEFAAFTAAANAGGGQSQARTWTEADLSKLTNQAAQKLGSPKPIKDEIGKWVPEGETPHSRNIPEGQREAFAQAIEKLAGIEYAG